MADEKDQEPNATAGTSLQKLLLNSPIDFLLNFENAIFSN